ncbi:SBP domain [Dillenia turbinata]|uniref:SBP domain n=1 Tax=Dillenia turbinata TaxID=194707 RepID=A0AAN8YVE3_9MAGN
MESTPTLPLQSDDRFSSVPWDWDELFDFSLDDTSFISDPFPQPQPQPQNPQIPSPPSSDNSSARVRKRDPRLTCSNFLAGRVPCACPEIDEKMEEEEGGLPGKKRTRTVRTTAAIGTAARCQVPDCGTDISELKGYHRRHRVCLRCANASAVTLDGESKRYCQQCGKFHILPDFDEGKRSCRRKLERHNNRRRRKPGNGKGMVEKEASECILAEADATCDVVAGKDDVCLGSQIADVEALLESDDGPASPICSVPGSQNIQSDSVISFTASGETQMGGTKDNVKHILSSTYCDNKSAYSSVCPTGRISFKLYDWNPAEFPRRLRHQIFQWLASMPVELEGYIRPGCTILTMFITMPNIMWRKLYEDPAPYIQDLVATGMMLSGRGAFFVYLNQRIFRVTRDKKSVLEVKVELRAPKVHFVHPTCFEAGKPMKFLVCGSNLLQPKFRFLISFAGKYLACDYRLAFQHVKFDAKSAGRFDHQFYKICVPHTEPDLFGPAFIEVENESGLSNFVPVLIGDKEVCFEVNTMQQKVYPVSSARALPSANCSSSDLCELFVSRISAFSELLLDIAWLLKKVPPQDIQPTVPSSQIQRLTRLLDFLIKNDSTVVLERVLHSMKLFMDRMGQNSNFTSTCEADIQELKKHMDPAKVVLRQRLQKRQDLVLHEVVPAHEENHLVSGCSDTPAFSSAAVLNQNVELNEKGESSAIASSTSPDRNESLPLLNKEVVMDVTAVKEWPRKSCSRAFSNTMMTSRPLVFAIAVTAAFCFGVCVVLLHPRKASEFAVTIRRCLFNDS